MTLRADLDLARAKLAESDALLRSAQAVQTQAINALEQAVKRAVKDGLNTLSPESWPINAPAKARRTNGSARTTANSIRDSPWCPRVFRYQNK
ncbi:hypothetical protein QO034_23050 [Sedimentitalea sp. JM2-8]|uniref:Uncharacterized protein n=1 Tax=Sedimentitalea xiamensis TaxID=3050037 RepID=A0ABT7FL94_9RHOB|nr:hypothetical protein [Sedimentitalea xiamensis]MDK3075932.1 hypothetical protein [Sedimentitalea xiamensis]